MYIKSGEMMLVSGFVPRDAEYKTVGDKGTPLCKFSVKADEKEVAVGQREASWMNCTCWRDLADIAAGIKKGDTVLAAGKLRKYTYREEERTELVCDFVTVSALTDTEPSLPALGDGAPPDSDFDDVPDDADLPF